MRKSNLWKLILPKKIERFTPESKRRKFYRLPDEIIMDADKLAIYAKSYDMTRVEQQLDKLTQKVYDFNNLYFEIHQIN